MFAVPEHTIATVDAGVMRHPVRVALAYAADHATWAPLLRYDPNGRFASRVAVDGEDEIWLMSWLPGQHADIHDHGDTSGAFTVVHGELTETVLRADAVHTARATHAVCAGQTRAFGPGYVHQVRNNGPDPAASIHVYRYGPRTMHRR